MSASPSDRGAREFTTATELPHGAVPTRSDGPANDSHNSDRLSTPFPVNEPFFEAGEVWPGRRRGVPQDPRGLENDRDARARGPETDDKEVGSIMEERAAEAEPEWGAGPHPEGEIDGDQEGPAATKERTFAAADEHDPTSEHHPDNAELAGDEDGDELLSDEYAGTSAELEMAPPAEDADDDVHFGVAAKALGVSRKTVERMVKRGQLERGPSGSQATVSKRTLVAVLDRRRQGAGHSAQPAVVETAEPVPVQSAPSPWPFEETAASHALISPLLQPWIEELVASRTRTAILESQVERLTARSAHERARDELLLALATGNWRQRRRARRYALRQFVREYDES